MGAVSHLAAELDAPERTLRRAVADGTVRTRRLSTRRLRLADGEADYLRAHWELLARLRSAFRTESRIRLAILFGSMARGDGDAASDIDLLVDCIEDDPLYRLRLGHRLERRIGRPVDVAVVERTESRDPFFFLQALDEGRVIVDRDHRWPGFLERRPAIYRRAMRSYRQQLKRAQAAVDDLPSR
jgi:predicted nucleotidyltransferase